jgi:putative heme-binding domain-containing protein
VYATLSESENNEVRSQAQYLSVKFGDEQIFPVLRERLADPSASQTQRQRALDILLSGQDPELPPVLHQLLDSLEFRGEAIKALSRFDHPDTPQAILKRYEEFTAEQKQFALNTLASRASYALTLLNAIEQGEVPRKDLRAFTARQMADLNNKKVDKKLAAVWGKVGAQSEQQKEQIAQYKRMLSGNLGNADRSQGRAIYQQTCASCHKLFGEGGDLAPELTGSNRGSLDYLLQNIVTPNAVVGKAYQLSIVRTNDGRVVSGVVDRKTETALTVQTLNDQVVVDRAKVENVRRMQQSLMPPGLLQSLTKQEVRDLFAYLMSPKQVPMPGTKRIEGESLETLQVTAGDTETQNMSSFPAGDWSGDAHLWWTGAEPGAELILQLPTVEKPGQYAVKVILTKARDYGRVQFYLNGRKAGDPIDLFQPPQDDRADVLRTAPIELGTFDLGKEPARLRVEMLGANPDAVKQHYFAIDQLLLVPENGG